MPSNRSKPIRERLSAEAKTRSEARAKRSNAEQLVLLDSRPGESRRERARLAA